MRAAVALAAVYAFCMLAPHAALAFADARSSLHCLTESMGPAHVHQQADAKPHVHADGAKHQHAKHETPESGAPHAHDDPEGKTAEANCCGLFCITALAADLPSLPAAPLPPSVAGPCADQDLATRGPDRINRPPIV